MDQAVAARAAALLRQARAGPAFLDGLPDDCRPRSAAEGYEIQRAFVAAAGDSVAGFKIGATSARAQRFLDAEGPFYGRVLAANLLQSPARLPAERFLLRIIEPEFAFLIGQALAPRAAPYEQAEVAEAVAAVIPAIEIVTSAFSDWQIRGVPSLIADNGANGALVLGDPCPNWKTRDLASHRVTLSINGKPAGEGTGAKALGHPLAALTWLVNALSAQDLALAPDQVVSTGVVTPFVPAEARDFVRADFGDLGTVEVRFEA